MPRPSTEIAAAQAPKPTVEATPDYAGTELETLEVLENYRAWILKDFRPFLRGHAVEIGAGIGSYSQQILPHVGALELVEPSTPLHRRLASRFAADPRVTVTPASVEAWTRATPNAVRDTAVMINVLEHIADDRDVLRELHRVLRPGGHLLLFVPALMALYSPIDRLLGHHRRYHRAELLEKVTTAGFRVDACRYFDALGVVPWLVINRWAGATQFNPAAARLYDRVGVPFTRAVERLIDPPLGKNLILVATRV